MDRNHGLTPSAFAILLSLASGERHGYAIMREVADAGDGRPRLGAGTLYRSIKQLRIASLIEETGQRRDPALDDQRRRYYRLTKTGRLAVTAEAHRLDLLLAKAVQIGLVPAREKR